MNLQRLHSEEDIIEVVQADPWMMDILRAARSLRLPDWWVCAGFVRSKIWDVQHGFKVRTPLPDVDVVYFDATDLSEEVEKEWEAKLRALNPAVPWSVKNEARMHLLNHAAPYSSSVDAISKFTETATALGLSLDEQDQVVLTAPHGVQDAVQMLLRPTPHCTEHPELATIYEERLAKKNWAATWTLLRTASVSGT